MLYKPAFNKVLVEIDDEGAEWGGGNDESMLGKSFRQGKVISIGILINTNDYPIDITMVEELRDSIRLFEGAAIMWHEGAEAGTVFEEDGKQYGLIHWWDIIGVKE
jgi:hypothetical protein